jgi:hypothetical protein
MHTFKSSIHFNSEQLFAAASEKGEKAKKAKKIV